MSEDPGIVRKLMIATVTDADFLRGLRHFWRPDFAGSAWLWLAGKCFEHLDKYGEVPGRNIEPIWEAENRLDPDTKAELGELLCGLSEEYEKAERLNSEYLLEQACKYFRRELFLRKAIEIEQWADVCDLERAGKALRELHDGNEKIAAASAAPLKGTTARELMQMEIMEPEWVVKGIIPTGLTLLAGKPKSGKSYLMINLASQLAAGGKVFDSLETDPVEILYLGLEDTLGRIKKRMGEVIGPDRQMPDNDNLHFFEIGRWPKLKEGGSARLEQWVQEHPSTKLIIIDTLQKVRPPSKAKGNLYSEDYQAMEWLQEFAGKHRIGVIAVHHTKKSKELDVFDEISGSTGLTGATDTNMVFRKVPGPEQNIRQLHYQGRETGEGMLELTFENHRFHLVNVPETEESTKRISPQREVILHVLETQGWPCCEVSRADLVAAVGKNVGSGIDTILDNMVANGEIVKPRRGFYIHPHHAIRLRANEMAMEAGRKVLEMRRRA